MEPVGKLDQNNSDVIHHRQEHLAEILGLPGFLGIKAKLADFGKSVDDVGDVFPEMLLDLFQRNDGVLDDVMQQSDADTTGVEPHVRQDIGDGQGMLK